MLTLFKKNKAATEPAAPMPDTPQIDGRCAVQSMARQASTLGREAAEVRGLIIDTQAVSARQAKALLVLVQQLQQITHSQDGISAQAQDSRQAVSRARGGASGRQRGLGHRRHAAPGGRCRRADHANRVADAARRFQRERRGQARG